MSYTTKFFESAKRFQDKRKKIMDTYESRMNELEKHNGSEYYTEESAKAAGARDEALKSLKAEYTEVLYSFIGDMRKVNENRALTPPTEDELRLVQALKLRSKLTPPELQQAANALKGNETCLRIVQEIADELMKDRYDANGIRMHPENYMRYSDAKEMPIAAVNSVLNSLESSVKDFLEHDTKLSARIAKKHHENLYGFTEQPAELPKRPLFDTCRDCFKELTGVSGEEFERLSAAIDSVTS